jgi:hypothetical protein
VVFIHNVILLSHKEILSFAGKWMELGNVILSEVSQTSKGQKPHVLSHMWIVDLKHAAILWDMGHTKGRLCKGGIGQRKEIKT